MLHVNIPDNHRDSFYDGTVHVTLKDKVLQPSSASRHLAETTHILRQNVSKFGINLDTPMLLIYSDGGPDYRTSFWSVQLAHVMQFIVLDLDLLIAAHTAPHHSYSNHAERIMSLLNIAQQNSALQGRSKSEEYESRLKSLKTMTSIRMTAERSDMLETALLESTEPVIAFAGIDRTSNSFCWNRPNQS